MRHFIMKILCIAWFTKRAEIQLLAMLFADKYCIYRSAMKRSLAALAGRDCGSAQWEWPNHRHRVVVASRCWFDHRAWIFESLRIATRLSKINHQLHLSTWNYQQSPTDGILFTYRLIAKMPSIDVAIPHSRLVYRALRSAIMLNIRKAIVD